MGALLESRGHMVAPNAPKPRYPLRVKTAQVNRLDQRICRECNNNRPVPRQNSGTALPTGIHPCDHVTKPLPMLSILTSAGLLANDRNREQEVGKPLKPLLTGNPEATDSQFLVGRPSERNLEARIGSLCQHRLFRHSHVAIVVVLSTRVAEQRLVRGDVFRGGLLERIPMLYLRGEHRRWSAWCVALFLASRKP